MVSEIIISELVLWEPTNSCDSSALLLSNETSYKSSCKVSFKTRNCEKYPEKWENIRSKQIVEYWYQSKNFTL